MSHEENIPQRLRDFLDDEDEWHNLSQHYSDYLNHTGRWSRSKSRSRSLSTKDKEWVRQATGKPFQPTMRGTTKQKNWAVAIQTAMLSGIADPVQQTLVRNLCDSKAFIENRDMPPNDFGKLIEQRANANGWSANIAAMRQAAVQSAPSSHEGEGENPMPRCNHE